METNLLEIEVDEMVERVDLKTQPCELGSGGTAFYPSTREAESG